MHITLKPNRSNRNLQTGTTLLELILTSASLLILSSASLPIDREAELRRDLREIRNAIDRYKDLSDQGRIRVQVASEGYPPDLETLVNGVNVGAGTQTRIRFLRRIPKDPMTGQPEWGLRAIDDDPDATSWGGHNVFDIHSKSQATALDGTRYSSW